MGDSQEGGGGSVRWKLEAKDVSETEHKHEAKKVEQKGKDEDGVVGTDFTVSVQVRKGFSPEAFLIHLRSQLKLTRNEQRVYFNHPIEEDRPEQIRVSWGSSNHHEGNGGKPTLALPGPAGTTPQA